MHEVCEVNFFFAFVFTFACEVGGDEGALTGHGCRVDFVSEADPVVVAEDVEVAVEHRSQGGVGCERPGRHIVETWRRAVE